MDTKPYISVLIPLLNEQDSLPELQQRIRDALEGIGKPYEIIYINDGSIDNTQRILEDFHERFPGVKVIEFNRNYGQHMALFAGFQFCQGDIIITIDGDLQNPPEEIPRLVSKMEEGYEVVATFRKNRHDSFFRRFASNIVNKITSRLVGVKLKDYGCMLRAYSRPVIDHINMCTESSSFIPALANTFARKIVEIEVAHEERKKGQSKYSIFKLLRLNFDLMTSFSLLPIQFIGVLGSVIALLGLFFALFLFIRRLIIGPESEGAFTLFGILFFFIGIQIFALGVIGEYIGRIYQEVRRRPRYIIKKELF
ncbi:MAG TPA: glycosyltransferase [Syntrophorhabdus sp.]|jgi:undecaprenyl-phosphate 4-deoxy-4-formamido-L-arabinose transferase|nr:glycosyltransferase [Syntrophorhabdus sp.]MDI9558075.1 glycosyltransferase [Pseudomonadota bacterium]OPX92675.1 MAG: Undecaprenyl-phosphate 4-deoxy-4-formamido-L-arabinose transferase [Syntrophorhabdus sp. PtaB.Bin027]OQB76301.1 MAG: Undecaprenyl-phosphate 4-deoxy-4-formamido-L-arabinose transferase [Deltaproteobacteria bacterium ADurb.Bin135]MBP8744899.1 glycosyltransferase [Syntrophorhabdus sp.]